jgi:hypothetical protein
VKNLFCILLALGWSTGLFAQTNSHAVGSSEQKQGSKVEEPKAAVSKLPPAPSSKFQFAIVHYEGGSWQKFPESMDQMVKFSIPRYLTWLEQQKYIQVDHEIQFVKLSDPRIFNFPFLYIGGHYQFNLTEAETKNLKAFFERGGGVYFDYYGTGISQQEPPFSEQINKLLKSFYPEGEMKLLPKSHSMFKTPFSMPVRRPEHIPPDKYDPARDGVVQLGGPDGPKVGGCRIFLNGFHVKDRLVAFYSDSGSCYEGSLIRTSDPANHDRSFQLFTNMLIHMMTH